jgi:hypothetical protein
MLANRAARRPYHRLQAEWIPLRTAEFYAEHDLDMKIGARVTAIDAQLIRYRQRMVRRFPTAHLPLVPSP